MFTDFLCDKVDIYQMQRNTSNRINKDQMANDSMPIKTFVPCRLHGDKAIFLPEIELSVGDVIEDKADNERYEITDKRRSRGLFTPHHRSYVIKRRTVRNETV